MINLDYNKIDIRGGQCLINELQENKVFLIFSPA